MSKSFQKLAETYRNRIFTYALYGLGRREEAEDVTQDVLVKLWQNRDGIDPERVGAWVMRVTRNAVIDVARRRKTRGAVIAEGVDVDIAANYVAAKGDPERETAASEFREDLEVALKSLNEPYRTIVVMREIQQLAYGEIAGAMDMPLNTVKVYIHRARGMLRDALKEKYQRDVI